MSAGVDRRGFTLLEVMISTIILSIGLVVLLTSFANCQRIMTASRDYETAQYVLSLGETVYPIPTPDLVTGDPIDDEQLNIKETATDINSRVGFTLGCVHTIVSSIDKTRWGRS